MGPFKCPDCGVWWAGFEHRCRIETITISSPPVDFTVRCTCPPAPPNYVGDWFPDPYCPVHRYGWTYTSSGLA